MHTDHILPSMLLRTNLHAQFYLLYGGGVIDVLRVQIYGGPPSLIVASYAILCFPRHQCLVTSSWQQTCCCAPTARILKPTYRMGNCTSCSSLQIRTCKVVVSIKQYCLFRHVSGFRTLPRTAQHSYGFSGSICFGTSVFFC